MKRPQRDVVGDGDLVDGVVGLAAIAERMRALVTELAADPQAAELIDAELVDSELVDAMLGLYALAAAIHLSDAEPARDEASAGEPPAKDLLR